MSARSRRLAAALAAAMAALAIVIATVPLAGEPELAAPVLIPRPMVTGILLAVPAAIASIAVLRRSPLMLVVAGLLAFTQSFIAFSGATLGFLLPGLLLIILGVRAGDSPGGTRSSLRQRIAGICVIALVVSAWLVVLGTSETVCWIAGLDATGAPVYRRIPITNSISVGPTEIGRGCDSGVPTAAGLLTSGALILGSLALAWLASSPDEGAAKT